MSRRPLPKVNPEDLKEFFAKLTPEERKQLEMHPPDRFEEELRNAYFRSKFEQRFGGPFGRTPFRRGRRDDDREFGRDRPPRNEGPPSPRIDRRRGNGRRPRPDDPSGDQPRRPSRDNPSEVRSVSDD